MFNWIFWLRLSLLSVGIFSIVSIGAMAAQADWDIFVEGVQEGNLEKIKKVVPVPLGASDAFLGGKSPVMHAQEMFDKQKSILEYLKTITSAPQVKPISIDSVTSVQPPVVQETNPQRLVFLKALNKGNLEEVKKIIPTKIAFNKIFDEKSPLQQVQEFINKNKGTMLEKRYQAIYDYLKGLSTSPQRPIAPTSRKSEPVQKNSKEATKGIRTVPNSAHSKQAENVPLKKTGVSPVVRGSARSIIVSPQKVIPAVQKNVKTQQRVLPLPKKETPKKHIAEEPKSERATAADWEAFKSALSNGDIPKIKVLIPSKIKVDETNIEGKSPLQYAQEASEAQYKKCSSGECTLQGRRQQLIYMYLKTLPRGK